MPTDYQLPKHTVQLTALNRYSRWRFQEHGSRMSQRNQMQNFNEQKILPVACLRTLFLKGISTNTLINDLNWKVWSWGIQLDKRKKKKASVTEHNSRPCPFWKVKLYNFLIKVKMVNFKRTLRLRFWMTHLLRIRPLRKRKHAMNFTLYSDCFHETSISTRRNLQNSSFSERSWHGGTNL